jgi:hypothetical protein
MYRCQQILINPDPDLEAILEFICGESKKLTNCAIYLSRQTYFKTGELIGKFDRQKDLKLNPYFGALYSQVAQQAIAHVSYDKRVANLKEGQPQGFWSKQLAAIAEKCIRLRWGFALRQIRGVAVKLGLDLSRISRGALKSPASIQFWVACESPCFWLRVTSTPQVISRR